MPRRPALRERHSRPNVLTRALMGGVVGAAMVTSAAAPARGDTTVCQYTATPRVCLGLDGPYLLGVRAVVEHWSIGCAATCEARKFWDDIKLVYAEEPETEITGVGSLASGSDILVGSGDQALDEPLMGVKIIPIIKGGCGDTGGVTSTALMEFRGEPLTIPPWLPPPEQIAVVLDDATSVAGSVVPVDGVPLGHLFHIHTLLGATPKGGEVVAVSLEGAGISFFKYYRASDGDVSEQFDSDPEARFVATKPDTITFSISFEGLDSPTRFLTVVPEDADDDPGSDPGGGAGGSGGGAGASPAGTPSGGGGGCDVTAADGAGAGAPVWLALAFVLRVIRSRETKFREKPR